MNERELVIAWVRGRDTDAFHELCTRYGGLAYATGLRILGNGGDAEEIAQESFLRLARQRTEISGSVGAWLHRVAVNLAIDRMRADGARRVREARYADARGAAVEPTWDDLRAHVDAAIDALPTKQRRAIVGHFVEGRSQQDLARAEGVSRASIHERIHRGLNSVREDLRRRGVMVGAATFGGLIADGFAQAAAAPAALMQQLGTLTIYAGATHTGPLATLAATVSGKLLWGMAAALLVTAGGILYLKTALPTPSAGTSGAVAVANGDATTPGDASPVEVQEFLKTDGAVATPEEDSAAAVAVVSEPVVEGATVEGYVREHETGRPLEAVGIAYAPDDGSNEMHYRGDELARTDSDGRYRISGLAPGRYKILCTSAWKAQDPGDSRPYEVELRFAGNMSRKILEVTDSSAITGPDFDVIVGQTVAGRVVDTDGQPIADAQVTLQAESVYLYLTSAEDGSFKGGGIPVGDRLLAQATKGETTDVRSERNGVIEIRPPDPGALTSVVIGPLDVAQGGIQNLAIEMRRGAALQGRFLDHRGAPLVGVHVMARSGQRPEWAGSRFGTTRDDGSFSLTGLASGHYELGWNPRNDNEPEDMYGWAPHDALILDTTVVDWGEDRSGIVLKAEPISSAGLTLAGRVTDSRGKPVPDAEVDVRMVSRSTRGETDADGAFQISDLDDSECTLWVFHPDYMRYLSTAVFAGSETLDIVLDDLGYVSGRVICADTGKPADKFTVGAMGGRREAVMVEDPEGRFRIPATFSGANVIRATAAGYTESEVTVDVQPGRETANVDVVLQRGISIEGTVVTDNGEPVAGAQIFTRDVPDMAEQREALVEARTDARGAFKIGSVSKLAGKVTVWHPDYPAAGDRYDATHTNLRIVLSSRIGTVMGHVTEAGNPASAVVNLYGDRFDPSTYTSRTRTDGQGAFTFAKVPEGAYRVHAVIGDTTAGSPRNITRDIEVVAEQQTDVDLNVPEATSSIEGRVTYQGQAPTSGMLLVNVTSTGGTETFNPTLEADGSFALDRVSAGRAELIVNIGMSPHTSTLTRKVEVDIPSDAAVRKDVAIDDRGAVRGSITGGPVGEQIIVRLLPGRVDIPTMDLGGIVQLSQDAVAATLATTGNAFTLDSIPDGEYTVVAWYMEEITVAGWISAVCRVQQGSTAEVDLRLP